MNKSRQASAISHQPPGFTLMETLVVLLMTGLISTLLIQGLAHVLNLRIHFLSLSQKQTADVLQAHWFQNVASGLFPGYPDEENVFSGDKTYFQGLTLAPLQGTPGVPTLIKMELVFEDREIFLQYQERDGETWEICRWTGDTAAFSYLDKEIQWHSQWKPPGLSEDESSQLPEGILLEVGDVSAQSSDSSNHSKVWFALIPGRHDPMPRIRDLIRNL